MEKQQVINKIENAITDIEYKHYNPDFNLHNKWDSMSTYVDYVLDTDRLNVKYNYEKDTIGFFARIDDLCRITIYKGIQYKEKPEIDFQFFFNLDTDSVNVFPQFYDAKNNEYLEIIYDTANKSVEDIIDDFYGKVSSLLQK